MLPVADGGDGTAEVLEARLGGEWMSRRVRGPLGDPVDARALLLADGRAVVEMASASGLAGVPEGKRDPMRSDTRGTGELIRAGLEAGAEVVHLGLGGSATVDGGAGCAHALGVRFLDLDGRELEPTPEALEGVVDVDRSGLVDGAERVEALVDVGNPLLGPRGAARVYGPQKGAGPEEVARLEAVLSRLARASGRPDLADLGGAGAAGGLGFGVAAVLGGALARGAERVCDLLGFDDALGDADLVVTGEGKLDAQSVEGKAVAEVARRAGAARIPCLAVCGVDDLGPNGWGPLGLLHVAELGGRTIEAGAVELARSWPES